MSERKVPAVFEHPNIEGLPSPLAFHGNAGIGRLQMARDGNVYILTPYNNRLVWRVMFPPFPLGVVIHPPTIDRSIPPTPPPPPPPPPGTPPPFWGGADDPEGKLEEHRLREEKDRDEKELEWAKRQVEAEYLEWRDRQDLEADSRDLERQYLLNRPARRRVLPQIPTSNIFANIAARAPLPAAPPVRVPAEEDFMSIFRRLAQRGTGGCGGMRKGMPRHTFRC